MKLCSFLFNYFISLNQNHLFPPLAPLFLTDSKYIIMSLHYQPKSSQSSISNEKLWLQFSQPNEHYEKSSIPSSSYFVPLVHSKTQENPTQIFVNLQKKGQEDNYVEKNVENSESQDERESEQQKKHYNISYFSFGEEKQEKKQESKTSMKQKEKKSFYENRLAPEIKRSQKKEARGPRICECMVM